MRRATGRPLRKAVSALAVRSSAPRPIELPFSAMMPAKALIHGRLCERSGAFRSARRGCDRCAVALGLALGDGGGEPRHKEPRRVPAAPPRLLLLLGR